MKQITTVHPEIGYTNNVEIIERALREQMGFNDASGLMTTLAQHVWSGLCIHNPKRIYTTVKDGKIWGADDVAHALASIQHWVNVMNTQLADFRNIPA